MPEKLKTAATIAENIAFLAFGIANIFTGVYLWGFHPVLSVAAFAASLVCIVRGASELLDFILAKR